MASSDDLNPSDDNVELNESDDNCHTPTSGNKGKRKEQVTDDEEDTRFAKKTKTRSWVWDHFTKLENNPNKASCQFCQKVLSCDSKNGTSAMKKHLTLVCKGYMAWADKGTQTVITPGGADGSLRLSKVSEAVFREATNEMIVLGELPLSFVESLAWRHFCSKAQLYKPHSRRTVKRDIVEYYVSKKATMKKILGQNKQRLSLTTDIWVSTTTGASYMVITAHFVDAMWKLRKMVIGFKNVDDHKGDTICNVLLECLAEWDIKRVFCITVDNATANSTAMTKFKKAMKQIGDDALILKGEYMHLRCASHILNLIVREGLQEIDNSVAAIRNGVQYVRASTNRLKSFDLRLETVKIKRGSLPLDVKTRWNSTYLMLDQAMKFRSAFERMEAEDKLYNDYFQEKVDGRKRIGPPKCTDWDEVERLISTLVIFYKSTLVLSTSNSVASHKLYNEIVSVTKNLSDISTSTDTEDSLKSKALSMLSKLGKYWDPFGEQVEMNRLVMVATVFDPRKKMKFAELCFGQLYGHGSMESIHLLDDLNNILKDLFNEYRNRTGGVSSSQSQFQEQAAPDYCKKKGIVDMENVFDEIVIETGIFQSSSNELEIYLKEKVEKPSILKGSEYDLLSWWKVNGVKYPVLSLIAKDILAMQVSSVASESAFSTSGRILDPYRSCLTHHMVEVLICTEQWLKAEIHINEKGVSTMEHLLSEVEYDDELMREFEPEFKHLES